MSDPYIFPATTPAPSGASHVFKPTPAPCAVCGRSRDNDNQEGSTEIEQMMMFYETICSRCAFPYWNFVHKSDTQDAVDVLRPNPGGTNP